MKIPDDFLTPSQAAKEWGITRAWIWQRIKRGDFSEGEVVQTPWGNMVSRASMQRLFGEPTPDRIAPNSGPRKPKI